MSYDSHPMGRIADTLEDLATALLGFTPRKVNPPVIPGTGALLPRLVAALETIAENTTKLVPNALWIQPDGQGPPIPILVPEGSEAPVVATPPGCPKCGKDVENLPAACPEVECPMGCGGMSSGV